MNTTSNLAAMWARAGAMFLAPPAATWPDVEALLLDTARQAGGNARLFVMAATWMARHGQRVSGPRLARLIRDELEPQFKPVMGLLLNQSQAWAGGRATGVEMAIDACEPAAKARPLFDIASRNPTLMRLAERDASPLARKWNLWAPSFEPKFNAIRPAGWVASDVAGLPVTSPSPPSPGG